MMTITKIILIISSCLLLAAAGWIIGLNIQLSTQKARNFELKTEISRKETQIVKAENSLTRQNDAIEYMQIENVKREEDLQERYKRLDKKYMALSEKSKFLISEKPNDCQTMLSLIYEAQEAFLWTEIL